MLGTFYDSLVIGLLTAGYVLTVIIGDQLIRHWAERRRKKNSLLEPEQKRETFEFIEGEEGQE